MCILCNIRQLKVHYNKLYLYYGDGTQLAILGKHKAPRLATADRTQPNSQMHILQPS